MLEPHDLLASKYIAGRPKDLEFCKAVIHAGVIDRETLIERLETIRLEHPERSVRVDVARAAVAKSLLP